MEGLGHLSSTGFCFISLMSINSVWQLVGPLLRLPWIPPCVFLDSLRFPQTFFQAPVPKLIVTNQISHVMAFIRFYVFFSRKYLSFPRKFQQEGIGLCMGVFPYIGFIFICKDIHIEMFKYEIVRFCAFWKQSLGQDIYYFKDSSSYLKQGTENPIMWSEIQKRFPEQMLDDKLL